MRVLFLRTKTLICCNKRNHEFIFYTLRKTVKIRRRRLTDSVVMTRKEGYDQLVMSRNSSRIKASRKYKEGFCLATKIRISFWYFQSFTGFFQNNGVYGGWRFFCSQFCLFICCTEDHPCTVVNNDTCALRDHTVN